VTLKDAEVGLEKGSRNRHLRQRMGRAPAAASISKPIKCKKGESLKCLILRNPKRQIRAVMRHNETIGRQKPLALLTVVCQCVDC
jgi:hypothetical protein